MTAGSGGTGRFVVTGRDRQGHVVAYTSTDNGPPLPEYGGSGREVRTANHRDPVTPPHLAGGKPGVLPGEFRPKGDLP